VHQQGSCVSGDLSRTDLLLQCEYILYMQQDWRAVWLTCTWPAALVLLRVQEVLNQLLVQLLGLALV
jgi:hypothetical protein